MYDWLFTVNNEFWTILHYSNVVWDINTKFSPVNVPMSIQRCAKRQYRLLMNLRNVGILRHPVADWFSWLSASQLITSTPFWSPWLHSKWISHQNCFKLQEGVAGTFFEPHPPNSSPGVQSFLDNPKCLFVTHVTIFISNILICLQELELVFGHTDERKDTQTFMLK